MSDFTFECVIDGQSYSRQQLATVQYQRDIHVLHEFKRAGAPIKHEGKELTHDEINRLVAAEAFAASVATRTSYDPEGITKLFKDQLAESDEFWRELNRDAEDQPLQACIADLTITGIPYQEFITFAENMAPFLLGYAKCHPDHFYLIPDGEKLRGVEIFGMYGGPTEFLLTPDPSVSIPIGRDESYPFAFKGAAVLSDGANMNAPAFLQFKPTENGLKIKAGCAFPGKAPKEMVEGHKLHLALEFLGFTQYVYDAREKK